ncbi:MAG: ParB/RepB/Spo0J family partition protein [Candidatus Kapabacteria bacterium]|nr:ParB/RepB/Spo0J family partition protein [Candidatus Kapabacteria bacterium]
MTKKLNTGLGKGLGALLPSMKFNDKGFNIVPGADEAETIGNVTMVEISKIRLNPYQPRKDFDPDALEGLKQSIIEHGLITPITVRRDVNGFELIAGERRLRACSAAGLSKVPVYILDISSDSNKLELALIENIQRENLNPIEIANSFQRLIDECKLTQEQVSVKVGKDRTTVTNFLRLLRLPAGIQDSIRNKELSMGHARALLSLTSTDKLNFVWKAISENLLSVRATEKLVREIETGKIKLKGESDLKTKSPKYAADATMTLLMNELSTKLIHKYGTQVKINTKSNESGTFEFEFYSKDDFERLLDLFLAKDK